MNKYSKYKSSAKQRNRVFLLEQQEFDILVNDKCHYCDFKFPNLLNGVDRKDNKIDYVKENCVTCCSLCNMYKYTTDYNIFINIIKSFNSEKLSMIQFEKFREIKRFFKTITYIEYKYWIYRILIKFNKNPEFIDFVECDDIYKKRIEKYNKFTHGRLSKKELKASQLQQLLNSI